MSIYAWHTQLPPDYFTDVAKPSYQDMSGHGYKTPWDDLFVDELRRGLVACRVFVFFPIYWLVYSQMLNNFISQGKRPLLGPLTPTNVADLFLSWYNGAPRHPQRHHAKYPLPHNNLLHPHHGPHHLPSPPPPLHLISPNHPHNCRLHLRCLCHGLRCYPLTRHLRLPTLLLRSSRLRRRP